jgi:peptidyl-prolyl cis-trans isomerase B (cyclophilin B)
VGLRRLAPLLALAACTALAQDAPTPAASSAPAPEAVVTTALGSFTIRLRPDLAPGHVALFLKTARSGGYDGTTFHRVIPGGIIQGGDPYSKDPKRAAEYGRGGLGLLKAEFSDRPFVRGVVAAARRPSDVNSGGNQFFVVVTEQPSLKGQFTIFGEVVEGMEAVDKISQAPADGDRARDRIEMKVAVR